MSVADLRWPPAVTPAAGCAGVGPELARFGDLALLGGFLLGPLGRRSVGQASAERSRGDALRTSPAGLIRGPGRPWPVDFAVQEFLPWLHARGVAVTAAITGGSPADLADVALVLRRSLDLSCVRAVEVDLTAPASAVHEEGAPGRWTPMSADPQLCLQALRMVREHLPRDQRLVAKVGVESPDPVAAARAAIGGGASALLLSGATPADHPGEWLSGPAILPITRGLVHRIRGAIADGRVPDVPLLAVGGVHDLASARTVWEAGAVGLQVGTAALSRPWLLWELSAHPFASMAPVRAAPAPPHAIPHAASSRPEAEGGSS